MSCTDFTACQGTRMIARVKRHIVFLATNILIHFHSAALGYHMTEGQWFHSIRTHTTCNWPNSTTVASQVWILIHRNSVPNDTEVFQTKSVTRRGVSHIYPITQWRSLERWGLFDRWVVGTTLSSQIIATYTFQHECAVWQNPTWLLKSLSLRYKFSSDCAQQEFGSDCHFRVNVEPYHLHHTLFHVWKM